MGQVDILSLDSGVETVLRPGMTFHIPPALRIYGRFTVGISETVAIIETGDRALGTVPRDLLRAGLTRLRPLSIRDET